MAATYKPSDALDVAKRYVKNMPLDEPFIAARILDSACKYIWMAAPWRWTIGALPAVTLAATVQDYPFTLPSDFLYAIDAYQTDSSGNIPREMEIVPVLPPGGLAGQVSLIAITGTAGATGTLRTSPIPPALQAGTHQIISLYKKIAPVVTAQSQFTSGFLVMDDEWFFVYESAVKWLAYQYADDQRAGSAEISGGNVKFTGQRAILEADIQMMREREKLLIANNSPGNQKKDK